MTDEEQDRLVTCLEAAREITLTEILQSYCAPVYAPSAAELAGRVNAINQLLAFLKVK